MKGILVLCDLLSVFAMIKRTLTGDSMPKIRGFLFFIGIMAFTLAADLRAADGEDLDAYKLRIDASWWFSHPDGYFRGKNDSGQIELTRDFGFGDYSTFSGLMDWRFKRKHHMLFGATPVVSDKTTTLERTIEFEGQTYDIGMSVNANIKSLIFAPGYQYDIIRRNHGYIAFATEVNLIHTTARLTASAQVNDESAKRTSSGSIFAPLPIVGTRVRWYLGDSGRFSLDGSFQGMYFFGYGDFLTASGAGVVRLKPHLNLRAGYQMGTRLRIRASDEIGLRLTQTGVMAGIEMDW
jgi:hypothetical protein